MNFIEKLKESARKQENIICMGTDPVLEKIPIKEGNNEEKIVNFYSNIIDACLSENIIPATIKPNYAFYAQYGFAGLRALKKVIEKAKITKVPIILDAKRGDIGKTSEAYAKEVFNFWQVDAVTVAPYMGSDSVKPFIDLAAKQEKGVYILNRTSNPGAVDLQNLQIKDKPLYLKVAAKIVEWSKGNVGAVVGATSPNELEEISTFYVNSSKEIPLLIPGVGEQGGTASEVIQALIKTGTNLLLHRINSSSGINYAWEKEKTEDYTGAAIRAIKKLNGEINLKKYL